jgi:hypothetical protein
MSMQQKCLFAAQSQPARIDACYFAELGWLVTDRRCCAGHGNQLLLPSEDENIPVLESLQRGMHPSVCLVFAGGINTIRTVAEVKVVGNFTS